MNRVIIEVGHGQRGEVFDPGAIGPAGVYEHEQVLILAGYVRNILQSPTCDVTIIDDYLADPATFHAANPCDAFLSLHLNAFNRRVQGSEVYVSTLLDKQSVDLAEFVMSELYAFLKLPNRGVKEGNLRVLRGAASPACLVEPFFIDSMNSRAEVAALVLISAQAIARGVTQFLRWRD